MIKALKVARWKIIISILIERVYIKGEGWGNI